MTDHNVVNITEQLGIISISIIVKEAIRQLTGRFGENDLKLNPEAALLI
jgi:hypothetical protein